MVFPNDKFVARLKEGEGNYEFFSISRNSKRHNAGKNSHPGERTRVGGLLNIGGFGADFIREYCFSCKKVIKLEGIIFNNDENICYARTFLDNKTPETFEELDGSLGF